MNKFCLMNNYRFPRMRGDVPQVVAPSLPLDRFSPHARGCSLITGAKDKNQPVFPACAGMFLRLCKVCCGRTGFPRMRGDVPDSYGDVVMPGAFSPHARGCSVRAHRISIGEVVFPACAGMFRLFSVAGSLRKCFPRMRGDVPHDDLL